MAVVMAGFMTAAACGAGTTSTTVPDAVSPTTTTQGTQPTFGEDTVLGVLAADGRFTFFLELLQNEASSLMRFLSDQRFNGTLFAPTDEAFAALDAEILDDLRQQEIGPSQSGLMVMLQHHVVAGRWRSDQLRDMQAVGPGATEPGGGHGGAITIAMDGDAILLDGALLSEADVEASNGVVHVIESVMLTEELVGSP
jgi:uncharacterized surface protein with fasciclin (FAS1) repeats